MAMWMVWLCPSCQPTFHLRSVEMECRTGGILQGHWNLFHSTSRRSFSLLAANTFLHSRFGKEILRPEVSPYWEPPY